MLPFPSGQVDGVYPLEVGFPGEFAAGERRSPGGERVFSYFLEAVSKPGRLPKKAYF